MGAGAMWDDAAKQLVGVVCALARPTTFPQIGL